MATVKKPFPDFWVTGLSRVLVGDQPCKFAVWFAGHFKFDKVKRGDDSRLAQYKIAHTEQLTAELARLKEEGWKCRVEQWCKLTGTTAAITGKPDIIRQREGNRPTITDIKSGQPKDSDTAQVLAYQVIVPMVWNAPTMQFGGEVVYPEGRVVLTTPQEAQAIRPKLFQLVRELASDVPPEPSPSLSTCRFCDVPKESCSARIEEDDAIVLTSEF